MQNAECAATTSPPAGTSIFPQLPISSSHSWYDILPTHLRILIPANTKASPLYIRLRGSCNPTWMADGIYDITASRAPYLAGSYAYALTYPCRPSHYSIDAANEKGLDSVQASGSWSEKLGMDSASVLRHSTASAFLLPHARTWHFTSPFSFSRHCAVIIYISSADTSPHLAIAFELRTFAKCSLQLTAPRFTHLALIVPAKPMLLNDLQRYTNETLPPVSQLPTRNTLNLAKHHTHTFWSASAEEALQRPAIPFIELFPECSYCGRMDQAVLLRKHELQLERERERPNFCLKVPQVAIDTNAVVHLMRPDQVSVSLLTRLCPPLHRSEMHPIQIRLAGRLVRKHKP
ncbi:hypothetical protein AC579_951 [Pseudocercospora musae]|uniref:Uncharacterized protein n=1 Tax=Pseudocercospora musae TaxID=113226 RepID=A0A139IUM3_9PEZI|nr:hypothetical protein AC579_951 [Pseudocercospora musae]